MEKQILSEEFRRMQKLAGIITENEDITIDSESVTPIDFLQDMDIKISESRENDLEEMDLGDSSNKLLTISTYISGIIFFIVMSPLLLLSYIFGRGMSKDIEKLKFYYKNYQMGKEVDENQVRAIIEKLTNELNSLSSQKKRFLKGVLNALSDAGNEYAKNPSVGKSKILGIEKKLKRIIKRYNINSPEELANIDDEIFTDYLDTSDRMNPFTSLRFLPDPKN
jgi:hypothetical protein